MKASDVMKKKGEKSDKPATKLIDWISQRRGKKTVTKDEDDK